jgi:hypothetical protein
LASYNIIGPKKTLPGKLKRQRWPIVRTGCRNLSKKSYEIHSLSPHISTSISLTPPPHSPPYLQYCTMLSHPLTLDRRKKRSTLIDRLMD